jgi:aspartyl-tRNA(Asn)/glutamyl-tRNA(Gln) amidotransferase subunit A
MAGHAPAEGETRTVAADARELAAGAIVSTLSDPAHISGQPLSGMTVPIKDNIDVAGLPTRAGSPASPAAVATADAEVVRRLRLAGAVVDVKTSMDEFACTTLGPGVCNPHDSTRSVGGSSSGSALVVAAGVNRAAIGTDTGGSVRIPAAYCGIVGFKPTYQAIPVQGVVPLSPTLDHVGILARDVSVASAVFAHCTTGPRWPTAVAVSELRLGVPDEPFLSAMTDEVRRGWQHALRALERAGARLVRVQLPDPRGFLPSHFALAAFEAASYHDFAYPSLANHGPDIREVVESGRRLTHAQFAAAQNARLGVIRNVAGVFQHADVIVLPTAPTTAPLLDADKVWLGTGEQVNRLEGSVWYTALFNQIGGPAISLPVPGSDLPVGLQLAAAPSHDGFLLGVAAAVEELIA